MTSKLVLDNLAGRTTAGSISVVAEGNGTTTNLQQGLAKAWVNYNGDTSGGAILDSFNHASVTDSATGKFRTNFTNIMSNANCNAVGMTRGYHIVSDSSDDKTTTGELHMTFYVSGTGGQSTAHDISRDNVSYFGDLA
mgnify:CR=1 FL=1